MMCIFRGRFTTQVQILCVERKCGLCLPLLFYSIVPTLIIFPQRNALKLLYECCFICTPKIITFIIIVKSKLKSKRHPVTGPEGPEGK
jgi:hypothetical protein